MYRILKVSLAEINSSRTTMFNLKRSTNKKYSICMMYQLEKTVDTLINHYLYNPLRGCL